MKQAIIAVPIWPDPFPICNCLKGSQKYIHLQDRVIIFRIVIS